MSHIALIENFISFPSSESEELSRFEYDINNLKLGV